MPSPFPRVALGVAALAVATAAADPPAKPIDFNRDVRPILSENCFACHGPDEKSRMAGLRLDTRDGAFANPEGKRYIMPGDPAASLLVARIAHDKKAMRMPPPQTGKVLSESQVTLIRKWIEQGAKWETHWSYLAPKRPELPAVKTKGWVRTPIDAFVLARLEQEGLKPSPEADARTLLRRVTLDLTGLPPTPEETRAFLADRSKDAYEKVVNRLLESPHYGERMALNWLDLARYADTHGYHIDSHRDMWAWRDWVIEAFNSNMPFDRFTVEQLAGDLLPDATPRQQVASGFNRNHMINFEGGAIPEEYLTEYVVDRLETTANVWLGMTIGCARCHDHKYDPISQRDFYKFFAFFNTVEEKGLDGQKGNAKPYLFLAGPGQLREMEDLDNAIAEKREWLADKRVAPVEEAWEGYFKSLHRPTLHEGIELHHEFDGSLADISGRYQHARVSKGELEFAPGIVGQALTVAQGDIVRLGKTAIDPRRQFTLAFWARIGGDRAVRILHNRDAEGRGFEIATTEPDYVPDLKLGATMTFEFAGGGGRLRARARQQVIFNRWTHVVLASDGSGAKGLKLRFNAEPVEIEIVEDALAGPALPPATLMLEGYRGPFDDLRVYGRVVTEPEIEELAIHAPAAAVAALPVAKRSREDKDRLRDYFLGRAAPQTEHATYLELKSLEARKEHLEHLLPSTMVMREMEEPRDTFVLGRGDYRNKTDKVSPSPPAMLPPLPQDAPANRLGLAQWLVDPAHPLAARVTVNRFWQHYFGTGLAKTAEDFGSQGEQPSHPALLDWLATEFISRKWDVKAMQKLIVMSAVYRQSSRVTPELRERDPENRLLARMSRFRLPAELVRDNALQSSGLLSNDIGGKSVFPYQPPGLWEEMAFGNTFSMQRYKQSQGRDLYRRSMYTFWKRTVPPASLTTFDAPDREKCVARRAITNTPLQALVLMNDPTYVEAARHLAGHMIREGGVDTAKRIEAGYLRVLARRPTLRETQVLREAAQRLLANYGRDSGAVRQLLAVGDSKADSTVDASELAAWTNVASTILSLDEAITKE